MKEALQIINEATDETTGGISPSDLYRLAGRIQELCGGVPRSAVAVLAARSGVPEARLWGALSAYPHINLRQGE